MLWSSLSTAASLAISCYVAWNGKKKMHGLSKKKNSLYEVLYNRHVASHVLAIFDEKKMLE
jgi:hypothetical protein